MLHSPASAVHSSGYLHCTPELGQLNLHSLLMQSKRAQLPSAHGVQLGGGSPQSVLVMQLATPQ